MRARPLGLAAWSAILLAACQAPPPAAVDTPADPAPTSAAWSHVEALAALGPRPVGSEGNAQARAYLVQELEKLDLEIVEQRVEVRVGSGEPFELVNVAGRIRGASDDAIVVASGYDTPPVESFSYLGVNEAASGPGVLLEIARALAEKPLAYTTWIVFLDGEAPSGPGGAANHFGSRALAQRLAGEGVLGQIRLAVVIEKVCDPDLEIARDLRSQRIYREEFWRAAARLGHEDVFVQSAYESPPASHGPLAEAGLRRVVALVDTSFGGGDPPGVYAGTADDDLEHCSAKSLDTVAEVALAGLGVISDRLAKIDRFAESPVAEAQALAWDTLGGSESEAGVASPEGEGAGESTESTESTESAPGGAAVTPAPAEGSSAGSPSAPAAGSEPEAPATR